MLARWTLFETGEQSLLRAKQQGGWIGEAWPRDLVYLTDRVLVARGEPQLYGTQFRSVQGGTAPAPIAEPARLDARRAEMGLGPFVDYLSMMTGDEAATWPPREDDEGDEEGEGDEDGG